MWKEPMNKKVLILNGSPRLKGNTKQMIDEFKRGAEDSGNEVTVFNLKQTLCHSRKGRELP